MPLAVAYARDHREAVPLLAPAAPHALWIGMDVTATNNDELSALAEAIVASNPYYVCCWGPACEDLHDAVDAVIVQRDIDTGREHPLIMTTWHTDGSLAEAVDFVLHCTEIADDWPPTPRAARMLLIGNTAGEDELLAAISSFD